MSFGADWCLLDKGETVQPRQAWSVSFYFDSPIKMIKEWILFSSVLGFVFGSTPKVSNIQAKLQGPHSDPAASCGVMEDDGPAAPACT